MSERITRSRALAVLGPSPEHWKSKRNELVRKHHPDIGDGNARRYQEAVDAYNLLTAPAKMTSSGGYADAFRRNYPGAGEMKENQFQSQIKAMLQSVGAYVFNIHGHAMQESGVPDIWVAHSKWTGFLELKVGSKYTPLQAAKGVKIMCSRTPAYGLRFSDGDLVIERMDTLEELGRMVHRRNRGTDQANTLLRLLSEADDKLRMEFNFRRHD